MRPSTIPRSCFMEGARTRLEQSLVLTACLYVLRDRQSCRVEQLSWVYRGREQSTFCRQVSEHWRMVVLVGLF